MMKKKIELHVPGYTTVPLQEKWVFFAKDNKIWHPGNRELYLYQGDCSTLSDHTPQGHAVSYRETLCTDKFCLSLCWCKPGSL